MPTRAVQRHLQVFVTGMKNDDGLDLRHGILDIKLDVSLPFFAFDFIKRPLP